jgi:pyroglutamyl-peptidase
MPRVLLTGFEPFDGRDENASERVVRALGGERISEREVCVEILPVVFDEAPRRLFAAIERTRPLLVVCVGEAGGRDFIAIERRARNFDDARIPDNAGHARRGPIARWGARERTSELPVEAIHEDLVAAGVSAQLSQSAGSFVCNHLFYRLMAGTRASRIRAGFIHVPWVAGPGAKIGMPLDTMANALRIVIARSLSDG